MKHGIPADGSKALLYAARAAFTQAGTSLRAWSMANGIAPSYACRVLAGMKNGPAAVALRSRILEAATSKGAR